MIQMLLSTIAMGNEFITFDWPASHSCSVGKPPVDCSTSAQVESDWMLPERGMGCKFVCLYLLMLVNASDLLSRILETRLLNWGHSTLGHCFFWLLQSDLKWDRCIKVSTTSASSGSLTVIKAESVKLSFSVLIGHHTWLQHPISTLLIVGTTLCWGDKGRLKERGVDLYKPWHIFTNAGTFPVTTKCSCDHRRDLGCIS